MSKQGARTAGTVLVVFLAALSVALGGCYRSETKKEQTDSVSFSITVEEGAEDAEQALGVYEPEERADGQYQAYDIFYKGVTSVTLTDSEQNIDLREAVQSGVVTIPQLIAGAEEDAEQGNCAVYTECGTGQLTLIDYAYPNYTMGVMNDTYISPKGEERSYKYVIFGPAGTEFGTPTPVKTDDGVVVRIDQEDWGITLTAQQVTASGMILHCAQSGKRLDGDLYLGDVLYIFRKTDDGWEMLDIPRDYPSSSCEEVVAANKRIPEGEEMEYAVSWDPYYSLSEKGIYNVWVDILKDTSVEDNLSFEGHQYKIQIVIS